MFSMTKSGKKIAILICNKYYQTPTSIDNNLFLYALSETGLEYELVVWDKPNIGWEKYSAVLIRATWDYIEGKRDIFIQTLEAITNQNVPLYNSIDIVRWNSHKSYLLDLEQKDVRILDTLIISKDKKSHQNIFNLQSEDNEYVIKPIISGGAYKTFRVKSANIEQILGMYFKEDEEIIIQPFMPEIINEGEWSFVFFNGLYSHAILLKPAAGDFRVQIKHGGTIQSINPTKAMIQEAKRIISMIDDEVPLYARVDFVRKNNQLYLMELELIEPALFFRWEPTAAPRLADALLQRLASN